MGIQYKSQDGLLTVELSGEIDHHSASLIRVSIDEAVIRKRPSLLVLDFDKVSFMDSSGIGLVMGRYRNLLKSGAELHITGTPPNIYKVMRLAGLEKLAKFDSQNI